MGTVRLSHQHNTAMSTQILTGIALTVTAACLYGFGTVFVQALDQTIPVFELNTLRLIGR